MNRVAKRLVIAVKRILAASDQATQTGVESRLEEIIAGLNNQSQLINQRLKEAILGIENQSPLINQRLSEVVQGLDNQSRLINQRLSEAVQGLDNQTQSFIERLDRVLEAVQNQSTLLNSRLDRVIDEFNAQVGSAGSKAVASLDQHHKTISAIASILQGSRLKKRETILLITHQASQTGAPIVAWNIAKRLSKRYNVVALILDGGELVSAFEECCDVVIGPVGQVEPEAAEAIVNCILTSCSVVYAIANSIESRRYVRPLARASVPVVSLIHEFASHFPEDAIDLLDWSTQIVFSANTTVDAAKSRFPHIGSRDIHVLAQGRCDSPRRVSDAEPTKMECLRAIFRPPRAENALVVLGVGTVLLRKGVDLFLACAAAISALHLQRPVRFVWIGSGYDPIHDRSYSPYLAEQIARSGLEGKVAIIDPVEDLDPIYEMADVFFLSSRLDPLPNVAIDAAYRGLPVVCFEKATGMADLFAAKDSLAPCVVPYLDIHAAASVIAQFANNEAMRKSAGSAMHRFAEATFDMDGYVNALDEIGRKAIAVMHQREQDFVTLRDDSLFDDKFYGSNMGTREDAIREFLADWIAKGGSDSVLRRPAPGFHPRIYARENSELYDAAAVNPLAHFVKSGRPSGPWSHDVITPSDKRRRAESVSKLRVGIHAHFYYPELAADLLAKIACNHLVADLLLTTDTEAKAACLHQATAKYDRGKVVVCLVPNRGRDIGPLFTALAEKLAQCYDVIGHVHSKRSLALGAAMGDAWREFLWQNLIGGLHPMMDIIIERFADDEKLGLVFPSDPTLRDWDNNRQLATELARRSGITEPLPSLIDFPIGSMFWSRVDALRSLFALRLGWADYPQESVPNDGTIMHALERLLPFAADKAGYRSAVTYVPGVTW